MSNKPVFVATHPRACSTAFERVFMTRRKSISTIHEPFGDAYYYGPERMGSRFELDEKARSESGFSESTFKTIMDRIDREAEEGCIDGPYRLQFDPRYRNFVAWYGIAPDPLTIHQGKRVFIKDITYYLLPPNNQATAIAPSLSRIERGVGTSGLPVVADGGQADANSDHDSGVEVTTPTSPPKSPPFPYEGCEAEPNNPTVVPREILEKFHFTFLIRHPKSAIPSYYRCCIPPLVERTGFDNFMPEEAGYDELRRLFDYLKDTGMVGPKVCTQTPDVELQPGQVEICVLDADDMLDNPEGFLRQYCTSIGLDFDHAMLNWDSEEAHQFAREQFEKWDGFHDDAINSTDLKPRQHKKTPKSDEQLYQEWVEKYGQQAADMIKQTVDDNVADYEYLKQFAIKV